MARYTHGRQFRGLETILGLIAVASIVYGATYIVRLWWQDFTERR